MRILLVLLILAVYAACATRYSVAHKYQEILEDKLQKINNGETVVFFLVDGLSKDLLKSQLSSGKLPQISKHFLNKSDQIYEAYAAFPSLTYTNIAGLLSEKPVHLSGAFGNTVFYKQKEIIHFESIFDRLRFAKNLRDHNVFSRLQEKQLRTASFDYGLGADATVATSIEDLSSGIAATFKNYLYLDNKRIEALEKTLTDTKPAAWPHFIFVHLIGVDFLSHQYGPESKIVKEYLNTLDAQLAKVFILLKKSELENHHVVSMLSADHGFAAPIKKRISIEELVHKIDQSSLIFNESRMAGIYTKSSFNILASKLLENTSVEITAYKDKDQLVVQSRNVRVAIQLVSSDVCQPSSMAIAIAGAAAICPEALDERSQNIFYPHLLHNLIYYFQAEHHPDVIAIPAPRISFSNKEIGAHGGPTRDEVLVPLLLRNASVHKHGKTPAIWQLLQFL